MRISFFLHGATHDPYYRSAGIRAAAIHHDKIVGIKTTWRPRGSMRLILVLSSVGVVIFLGWLLIISGAVQGISLIGAQYVPHFWLQVISVALSVIVGLMFILHPGEGLLTLTLLLIMFFMIEGISKAIFSLTIRPFPNWGWVLASGIVGILLALYLWAIVPVTAIWLLGVLLGIQLICEGTALGYLAWQVRQS